MGDRGPLIIVGASVRAAAMSALRAGYRPFGIDLFADQDLRRIAECRRVEMSNYPAGIGPQLRDAPPGPWVYTGGLENYPELIEEWRRGRVLIGNGADVLAKVRDPIWLCDNLPFAVSMNDVFQASRERDRPEDGGRATSPVAYAPGSPNPEWLRKPLRSAGGIGIEKWSGEPLPPDSYLQRFIHGESVSGVVVGTDAGCRCIGSSRQLIGETWLHAQPFRYCGSIGPRRLTVDERVSWENIGNTLARIACVRGVFGVDAVRNDAGLTVIEVNPRYPASAEVLEWGERVSLLDETSAAPNGQMVGKAVYFAAQPTRFPASGLWDEVLTSEWDAWEMPGFADIPAPGELFQAGDPVITMFSRGRDEIECLEQLRRTAYELSELLPD